MDLAPVIAWPYVVRAAANNHLHIRYELSGRTVDDARCAIGNDWSDVEFRTIEEAEPEMLCPYCFPATTGD